MASVLLRIALILITFRLTCIHDSWLWKPKIILKLKSHKDKLNEKNEGNLVNGKMKKDSIVWERSVF